MKNKQTIRIDFKGGIVSPEKLRVISSLLAEFGIDMVSVGTRQNIYFNIYKDVVGLAAGKFYTNRIYYVTLPSELNNIVSSYAAIDLFTQNSWLSESILKEILDGFDYNSRFKINIVDISQSLITAFDGDLVFIPSAHQNFWYLYIRNTVKGEYFCWPDLLYSLELGPVAQQLELFLSINDEINVDHVYQNVKAELHYISHVKDIELKLPRYTPVNYEGIHRNGNRSWIGIKNRSDNYPVCFIRELADLCIETGVSNINLTTWKNIIIKGIKESDIIKWEILFGKYDINIRHSSLELMWKTEDADKASEELKRYIINKFDETDTRTYGITFSIRTNPQVKIAGSILIEIKKTPFPFAGSVFQSYSVSHTEDFNPDTQKIIPAGIYKSKTGLVNQLKSLLKKYYKSIEEQVVIHEPVPGKEKQYWTPQRVYKCKHCFTIYDPEYGDIFNGIIPGISFIDLPDNYSCSLCGAPKEDFLTVRKVLSK